ncbi:MAG TPA: hypothetical protein VIL85_09830 [Thermomicrobiales bacterium]|jgi:hypothetical protein
MDEPRTIAQRKADTLARLGSAVDCWVPSASAEGEAYLIPLSFVWHEGQIIMATLAASLTVRNVRRAGNCRVALDGTRDVVLVEGPIEIIDSAAIAADIAAAFKAAAGFDPHQSTQNYVYILLTPHRIRAWREENELAGREIMRDGQWLA